MHDLRGLKLLCAAQDQVVVLAALEPAPKASDIAREIGPDGREVADIVLAAQQVGIPIRLEVRIESSTLRDRKSGGSGKSVSARVDLGGRRSIKKKKLLLTIIINSSYHH